jgi:hypothetical protein
MVGEGALIATVRLVLLWAEVTTNYRPRTDVERWQIQDRLALRLRQLGFGTSPRFYEGPGGRLSFRIRVGLWPERGAVPGLQQIDEITPPVG